MARSRKGRATPHPLGAEIRYRAAIRARTDFSAERALATFRDRWPELLARSAALRVDERLDDDLIASLLTQIADAFSTAFGAATTMAANFAAVVAVRNRRKTAEALEVDIFGLESWLQPLLDNWTAQNVALIGKLDRDQIDDIEGIIRRGFASGARWKTVAREIRDCAGVSARRAALIARDQTGTLSGQITRERHRALGITEYIWSTSRDERVRKDHRDRDGQRFAYGDGGPIPSEEVNCRCVAIPVIEQP